jgi:hypothetical protein
MLCELLIIIVEWIPDNRVLLEAGRLVAQQLFELCFCHVQLLLRYRALLQLLLLLQSSVRIDSFL